MHPDPLYHYGVRADSGRYSFNAHTSFTYPLTLSLSVKEDEEQVIDISLSNIKTADDLKHVLQTISDFMDGIK